MIESSDTLDDTVCGLCGGSLGGGRYVQDQGAFLFVFCSKACFRSALRQRQRELWTARRRAGKRFALGALFFGAFVAPHQGPPRWPPAKHMAPITTVDDDGPEALPPGWYGPEWPPTEQSLLAALGRDAWVHPLAGPLRRMPRADSRVFGAVRPGDRAIECRNGHCGVDLGGEIWGEHIRAVHDGVVDFVQRAANPDHGGRFVRLSHRNGTLFTQYFHLAAIPRGLERGKPVKSGELIGLLGDSGVKESAPHLHFAISIRPAKDWPEKYIDPEPLIALWPLRVPLDGSELGLVTTLAEPAVPLGSALLKSGRKQQQQKAKGKGRRPDIKVDPDATEETESTGDGLRETGRSSRTRTPSSDGEPMPEAAPPPEPSVED